MIVASILGVFVANIHTFQFGHTVDIRVGNIMSFTVVFSKLKRHTALRLYRTVWSLKELGQCHGRL